MKIFSALFVASLVAVTLVSAVDECPSTLISTASESREAVACESATNFSARTAIISPPDVIAVSRFCLNSDCRALLKAVSAIVTSECTYYGIKIKETLIDKFKNCDAAVLIENLTTAPTPAPTSSGSGSTTTVIVGIVIGVVVVVAIIAFAAFRCGRGRRATRKSDDAQIIVAVQTPPVGGSREHYQAAQTTPRVSNQSSHGAPRTKSATTTQSKTQSHSTGSSWGQTANSNSFRQNEVRPTVTKKPMWEDEALLAARVPYDSVFLGPLLSRGGFGEVYKGTYRGETVAIKQLLPERRKDMKQIDAFLSEVKLMSSLDHERIVKFIGVAWNALTDACVIVEYMDNGDLRSVVTRWDQQMRPQGFDADKLKIALHVAHALTYLHSLQPAVVHRDLKSKNILLDANYDAKLTDFGVSRERADNTMTGGVGSCLWMAPEVMLGERYDEKADVFSFGVVLSELDTHTLPYAQGLAKNNWLFNESNTISQNYLFHWASITSK